MTRKRSQLSSDWERARVRYRKVECAMWHDSSFLAMSPPQPSGQWLWIYLLTGPRTTPLPGLVIAREAVMADDLGWDMKGFRKAFQEAFQEGLLEADWKAGLVVLRKALITSSGSPRETARPTNPNVLKAWSKHVQLVPDCALKDSYLRTLKAFAEGLGEAFAKAFQEAFGEALAKALAKGFPHQDQESGSRRREERARSEEHDPLPIEASSDSDSESSRAHAFAPESQQVQVPASSSLYVDLAHERRVRLKIATTQRLNRVRLGIAGEFQIASVRPLPLQSMGERDLADRILESGADAETNCDHVLACAEAGARGGRTVKWLTGSLFGERQWRRFLGTTPAEAFADADREWRREHPDEVEVGASTPAIVSNLGEPEWDPFETPEAKAAIARQRAEAQKGTP